MKIIRAKNDLEMSALVADRLISCLKRKPGAMFCIATGGSPTAAYKDFVRRVREEKLDVSQMKILKLDEWYGMEQENPATCESYIREHLLTPLQIDDTHYISFHPMEANAAYECQRITEQIAENGGIDCCVLGIGKNGHLGLNEPGSRLNPSTRKVTLDERTKTHAMLESHNTQATQGYTLGLTEILSSREILLLLSGREKEEACKQFFQGEVSTEVPATFLWLHRNTSCFVNEEEIAVSACC